MDILNLDCETYSTEDIKNGAHKYSEKVEILLLAYSFNFEPVEVTDFTEWQRMGLTPQEIWRELPERLRNALLDPNFIKQAFNISFDRRQLNIYFSIYIPVEQCRCTLAHAGMAGYPMNLDGCAKALGLEQLKQSIGKALIRLFCSPCPATKVNGGRTRNMPWHYPEKWLQFIEYCRQDIVVEQAIVKAISWYKISDLEHQIWQLGEKKNERGVKVDLELIDSAIYLNDIYRKKLIAEAIELTGLANPNSRNQMKKWLEDELDIEEIKSLDKNAVSKMIREIDNEKAEKVLQIRAQISKSSITKYAAMRRQAATADARIRGMFQYYGAQKSGREAGRLSQPQNYPRLEDWFKKLVDDSREIVRSRDVEGLNLIFENVPKVLSQLLRTAFIAAEGKKLAVLDFKAVEAVILAHIADETWRTEFFRKGGDIYRVSAVTMFKIKEDQVTDDIRQKSKISELLCIEENQLVLTDYGTIPIKNVTLLHKVWDGEHFVTHEGVIYKGIKEVITYEGLTATKDHIVFSKENEQLQFGELATRRSHLLQSGNGRSPIRTCENNKSRETMGKELETPKSISSVYWLRNNKILRSFFFNEGKIKRLLQMQQLRNAKMVKAKNKCSSAAMSKSEIARISQLRREGDTVQIQFRKRSRAMDFRKHAITNGQESTVRQRKQRRSLRIGQFKIYNTTGKHSQSQKYSNSYLGSRRLAICSFSSSKKVTLRNVATTNICGSRNSCSEKMQELALNTRKAHVYDIVNAGPYNMFTVSNVLVHNCQYGGTKKAMMKNNDTIEDPKKRILNKEMKGIVKAWREANPNIVQLWWDTGKAAVNTVKTGLRHPVAKGISFWMAGKNLMLELPSGRSITYVDAHVKNYWMGAVKQKAEGELDEKGQPVYEIVRVRLGEVIIGERSEFDAMMREKRHKQAEGVEPRQIESLAYWGMDKIWKVIETYGPKLVQNFVEGWGRDLLMHSIINFEAQGMACILSVHDEGVFEIDEGSREFDDLKELMIQKPKWAGDMPLNADGFIGNYYKK